MAENVTVRMKLDRETPGTYLYKSVKEDAVITALYVKKAAYPDGAPQKIAVVVRDKDDG